MHEAITAIGNTIGVILIAFFVFWCGWRAGRMNTLCDMAAKCRKIGNIWAITHDEILEMRDGKR